MTVATQRTIKRKKIVFLRNILSSFLDLVTWTPYKVQGVAGISAEK
jgi:hypothetical protein